MWLIAASASSKLEIWKKALCVFDDPELILRCFWSVLLHMLENCSPVWMSAAASHLRLLDLFVLKAVRLSDGLVVCYLQHRHRVAVLCMFNKICRNPNHALRSIASGSRL